MSGKIPISILAIIILASIALASEPVLRTLSEEEIKTFYVSKPDMIKSGLIIIRPINPFNPILATMPKPVFDMNDIEPKAKQEPEEGDTPLGKIMQQVDNYYSGEFPGNNTGIPNPEDIEIPLYREGKRQGLLIPTQHHKVIMSPGSGKIIYGDYKMETKEGNNAIPPILIKKGKKKLSQIWVYLHNDSVLRVEDQDFRFFTDRKIEILDSTLYIEGFPLTVMPSEILPLNYNNLEYELFIDISDEGLKYILEYNNSKGILVLDALDEMEYIIEENTINVEGIKIKSNNRIDIGGQGFIMALTEDMNYLVTKDTSNNPVPINAKASVRNGRLDIANTIITVPPESIFGKYGSMDITLVEKDNFPWYHFATEKKVKLMFFFDKKITVNNYISASNIDKVVEEFPWWNFLVTSK